MVASAFVPVVGSRARRPYDVWAALNLIVNCGGLGEALRDSPDAWAPAHAALWPAFVNAEAALAAALDLSGDGLVHLCSECRYTLFRTTDDSGFPRCPSCAAAAAAADS